MSAQITLSDVVSTLFNEFEKINNPAIKGEQLKEQIQRTKAIVGISKQIVDTAALALDAQKALPDMMHGATIPPLLRLDK